MMRALFPGVLNTKPAPSPFYSDSLLFKRRVRLQAHHLHGGNTSTHREMTPTIKDPKLFHARGLTFLSEGARTLMCGRYVS